MMGEKRVMLVLGGLLLGGGVLPGCDRSGESGTGEVVDAGAQPEAVRRPEGVTRGPAVGVVVASRDALVVPSRGAPFAAEEGVMLVRDDQLSTGKGADSFVVVQLYNDHFVRFNQGTKILVEGISVFGREREGGDLAQRFEEALGPERDSEAMRGAISRVAGWNSRMTSAESFAPLPADKMSEKKTEAKKADTTERPRIEPGRFDPVGQQSDPPAAPPSPRADPLKQSDPTKGASDVPGQPGQLDVGEDSKAGTGTTQLPKNGPPPSTEPGTEELPDDAKKSNAKEVKLPARVTFRPAGGAEQKIELPPAFAGIRRDLVKCGAKTGDSITVAVKGQLSDEVRVGGRVCEMDRRKIELADGVLEMRVQ